MIDFLEKLQETKKRKEIGMQETASVGYSYISIGRTLYSIYLNETLSQLIYPDKVFHVALYWYL